MGKFKWIAALCIIGLLILPLGFFVISPKLNPLLNLVTTLLGEDAGDKMTLGSFSFVASDNDSLTLKIELGLNNTDGPEMLFPAVNLTFNYGSQHLGDGWINPAVSIPSGSVTMVPIYAKMHKGDAFNKFLFSLIGGGLSLSIAGGQAFVLNDLGFYSEVLTIPLPSIPLPAMDLGGATGWPPTIHKVYHGNVTDMVPVDVMANVTDRGGGVREVILSWNNGTRDASNNLVWVNSTPMTGLPMKEIMGGSTNAAGSGMKTAFPNYPNSTILTACPGVFGIVHGQIPGHSNGTTIQYRLYVIDDYDYVTLVPSTNPTHTSGAIDSIDLTNNAFSYTVPINKIETRGNFTAVWLPTAGADGGGAGGLADMMNSLAANGIDIFGAIMAGSSALSGPLSATALLDIVLPLVEYFETRGVNPFEIVDQLLGFSGGIGVLPLGNDPNPHINANTSVALDLLAEGGISLTDLVLALDVNLTTVVNSLGNSVRTPIVNASDPERDPYPTISDAIFTLLNKTYYDPIRNASLFQLFDDLSYLDLPLIIWKHNMTDDTWSNCTAGSFNIEGTPKIEYYFGSMTKELIGLIQPGDTFSVLQWQIPYPASPTIQGNYYWQYYDGNWVNTTVLKDETNNFTKSGRIFYNMTTSMKEVAVNGNTTMWVRLKILETINNTMGPTINQSHYSVDYIPYYFSKINVDMLLRPNTQMIPGEMDSFANLMRSMNQTHSYAMTIWSLLSRRGITYDQFIIGLLGGELAPSVDPITVDQIISTTSPTVALIIYVTLGLAIISLIRGRRGTYAIAPLRVKKWYDTMIVTPSLKGREEIDKYKLK